MTCQTATAPVKTYLLGNSVRIKARLTDENGTVLDPATLALLTLAPGATESVEQTLTPEDDEFAIGILTPDVAGTWRYRVECTTGVVAAYEHSFIVTDRTVPAAP